MVVLVISLSLAGVVGVARADDQAIDLFNDKTPWTLNLGREFPGAVGSFAIERDDDVSVAALTYDFSTGGLYVGASTPVNISVDTAELRFKIKSTTSARILIRLVDSTGQAHQWALPYSTVSEWATLRVNLRQSANTHFGGKNDGRYYFPLKTLWMATEKAKANPPQGKLLFKDLTLTTDRELGASIAGPRVIAPAATLPSPAEPIVPMNIKHPRIGVCTHFAFGLTDTGNPHRAIWNQTDKIVPLIDGLGVGWIRDELIWSNVEKSKGVYTIAPETLRWIDAVSSKGIKICLVLAYGNKLYEPDRYNPQAYAKAAAFVASELAGKVYAIEILNEPHNFGFSKAYGGHTWNGWKDGQVEAWVGKYVELINTAAPAIKAVNPNIKVIGLGNPPPVNFRQIAMGLAREIDGITEHPYSPRSVPELLPYPGVESILKRDGILTADARGTFASQIRMYRELSEKHNGPREIWLTEWGFPTHQEAKAGGLFAGFSHSAQTKYSLRRLVESLALGVDATFIYDLKDDGPSPFEAEHHFGLVDTELNPKPVYHNIRRMARFMADLTPRSDIVQVTVFPVDNRPDTHPIVWDGGKLATNGSILTYSFIHAAGDPVIALWSTERADGDLSPVVGDVEIKASQGYTTIQIFDPLTGASQSRAVQFKDHVIRLEKFTLPDSPILLMLAR